MIEVIGGNLFQWDTGRVAQVNTDANIHEVHFTIKDMTYAYLALANLERHGYNKIVESIFTKAGINLEVL